MSEGEKLDCLAAVYAQVDSELTVVFANALASLADRSREGALQRAQSEWLDKREALRSLLCSSVPHDLRPGLRVVPELTKMTAERVVFLRASVLKRAERNAPPSANAPENPSASVRERMLVASMKTDLRRLVTAEEAFWADSQHYTAEVGRGGLQYTTSAGIAAPRITLTPDGWTATITNAGTPKRCGIFVGSTPTRLSFCEGDPTCY